MFYDLLQCTIDLFWRHKGTPGYTAYILLHRSLAVLSIILMFCACVFKEFIIQKMHRLTFLWHFHILCFVFIAPNLVYFHNSDLNKVGSVNGTSVLLHLSHF